MISFTKFIYLFLCQPFLNILNLAINIFNKIVILFEIPSKKSQNKVLNEVLEIKLEKKYKAKIELIFINGRPSYSDFFAICRKYNENQKNQICRKR